MSFAPFEKVFVSVKAKIKFSWKQGSKSKRYHYYQNSFPVSTDKQILHPIEILPRIFPGRPFDANASGATAGARLLVRVCIIRLPDHWLEIKKRREHLEAGVFHSEGLLSLTNVRGL